MLPIESFRDCFQEIRQRIKERHRQYVGWRVLCRTVVADDGFLSPFYGRDTMTIACLQNNTLPHREYFEDLEPILRSYGAGRTGPRSTRSRPGTCGPSTRCGTTSRRSGNAWTRTGCS